MADINHIKLLCRGVAAWNKARTATPFVPDLSQVDIRDADLNGANFDSAELDGTRFSNVDAKAISGRSARLNGIRARHTDFTGSALGGAELKGSDFLSSCLRDVDMSGVAARFLKIRHCDCQHLDFSSADLEAGSHFYNSDLRGAVFTGAKLNGAEFRRIRAHAVLVDQLRSAGAALQEINNLIEERDEWVDLSTYKLKENRKDFPQILYQNQVYWINDGRWDFFISHASVDKVSVAEPLARALKNLGQEVWYDDDSIVVGEDLNAVITHGIEGSRFGVVILSKAFFNRRWTEVELDALQSKQIFLVRHGLEPEELGRLRPELADTFTLSSNAGPAAIAKELLAAIRKPRLVE